jgi:hypothetical protein
VRPIGKLARPRANEMSEENLVDPKSGGMRNGNSSSFYRFAWPASVEEGSGQRMDWIGARVL